MAFDSALHFLDELKDKYMHEVEKAIEDWDYQDFSPDKRTPLLENEIVGDVTVDDLQPETNALQQIKDAQALNWSGLNRDEMLAEQAFGRMSISNAVPSISYEARVVTMATPGGGVQGIPDSDATQRFLQHAPTMNPQAVGDAFVSRLQQSMWQMRAKALVLMEMLLESPDLVDLYLRAFMGNATLVQLLDKIRTQDHNPIARENARKVMSLIRSNGTNAMLVAREPVAAKPHVRHAPTKKKPIEEVVKPKLTVQTKANSPTKKAMVGKTAPQHAYQSTSPKIAAAALASWRRRSQKELLAGANDNTVSSVSPRHATMATMPPPVPGSPSSGRTSRTSSGAATLQKGGSIRSGFTFIDQPKPLGQQRVSITASRTQSFH